MVVIFTEAGKKYGYGHLMRCLALAQGFQKKSISSVFYLRGDFDAKATLKGFQYYNLDWLKSRPDIRGRIVIVDSYCADEGFCKNVFKEAQAVLFIDDYNRIAYSGGFVLNSSIGYKDAGYPDNPGITYLLGVKYHPLRREFCRVTKKIIRREIKKILITTGGNDPAGIIPKILRALKGECLEKNIIAGKGFLNVDEIRSAADKRTNLIYSPDAERMKKEMLEADICICGGGQTTFELARIGTPAMGICFSQNQKVNLEGWQKKGFLEYAGWYRGKGLIRKIREIINNMRPYLKRKSSSLAGKNCIDARGADRVTQLLLKRALFRAVRDSVMLKIREATQDDCRDIWHWRNHPQVRKMCYVTKPLLYGQHRKWFNNRIRNTGTTFLIAENEAKQKIGQVRFEKNGECSASINVNLNPDFFGKGLGNRVIRSATDFFMNRHSEIKDITAEIIDGNIASQEAFKKAGYDFYRNAFSRGNKIFIFRFIRSKNNVF